MSALEKKVEAERMWNTKNLGLRICADVVSAACAAAPIAPFIAMIDRSIMENAAGVRTLGASLRASLRTLVRTPHAVVLSRPFALIFMLYGGTYLTANALDTATATARGAPPWLVTAGGAKFAASSTANIGLCMYKDARFVRLFGAAASAGPVGLASYTLFAARDCMTIFASFNVPPLLGPWLDARLQGATPGMAISGQTLAQFAAPAAVQVLSTPAHLLGLDIYNRPHAQGGLRDRAAVVVRNWGVSTVARMCRILPAFGVGGVVNLHVRRSLMERLS